MTRTDDLGSCRFLRYSYDLEQDKKLSEDTTVLVENYTVSSLSRNLSRGLERARP